MHGNRSRFATSISAAAALLAAFAGAARAEMPAVVKIGVLTDMSGSSAQSDGQGAVVAARLAVEDAGGRVAGAPVEVVAADHHNKADVGSTIARSWFDQDGVDAIVDLPYSQVALAVAGVARDKDRAVLVAAGATSDLTGPACSPVLTHWTDDTYALAHGTARALTRAGGTTWFFITADYAFGAAMQRDATAAVAAEGGRVLGAVKHPLPSPDMSSYLTQAAASGAKVIGLANVGGDTSNAIKQAAEFGVREGGQTLAGLLVFINDVHALGLQVAQGLTVTTGFYWDDNPQTRAFAERFRAQTGRPPSKDQAFTYVSVRHWLRAVEAVGDVSGTATTKAMKAIPADVFGQAASIRADGRVIYDVGVWRVKRPEKSRGEWDLYSRVATIPAAEAFRPLADGGCPMLARD